LEIGDQQAALCDASHSFSRRRVAHGCVHRFQAIQQAQAGACAQVRGDDAQRVMKLNFLDSKFAQGVNLGGKAWYRFW
jgi:transcriptional regulator NrdR family protein